MPRLHQRNLLRATSCAQHATCCGQQASCCAQLRWCKRGITLLTGLSNQHHLRSGEGNCPSFLNFSAFLYKAETTTEQHRSSYVYSIGLLWNISEPTVSPQLHLWYSSGRPNQCKSPLMIIIVYSSMKTRACVFKKAVQDSGQAHNRHKQFPSHRHCGMLLFQLMSIDYTHSLNWTV